MTKILMRSTTAIQATWLRYASALCALLIYSAFRLAHEKIRKQDASAWFYLPRLNSHRLLLLSLGFATFFLGPILQNTGLASSQAIDNALIIAMEPLLTAILAWMILGDRLNQKQLLGFGLALLGFSLLSGLTPARLSQGWDSHLIGNLLILVSLLGESLYSPLSSKLLKGSSPRPAFGSMLFVGVILLTILMFFSPSGRVHWGNLSGVQLLALIWLGPLGTTVSYLFWLWALTQVPIASLVLTLFIQPLSGSIWGYLALGETLSGLQVFGGTLIVMGVMVPIWIKKGS